MSTINYLDKTGLSTVWEKIKDKISSSISNAASNTAPVAIATTSSIGTSVSFARADHKHSITLASGDSNGQIKIAGSNVSVKGLGSAAYTSSGYYASLSQLNSATSNVMRQGIDYVTAGAAVMPADYATSEGYSTQAIESAAHAEGDGTYASGYASHAEGYYAQATGYGSHAEGNATYAEGSYAHAEGSGSWATGEGAHGENMSAAYGAYSHSENKGNSYGIYSHAEGQYTYANGEGSHAEGYETTATHKSQHVFGEYNISDPSTATSNLRGTYVEIVGNGVSGTPSNARTLDWSGNEILSGSMTVGAKVKLEYSSELSILNFVFV